MDEFRKTPEGKVLMYGIHEHSNGLCRIGSNLSLLEKYMEKGTVDNEKLLKLIESIVDGQKKCKESIDYIYENIKAINDEKI